MPVGMPHKEIATIKGDPNNHLVVMLSTNILSWHYKDGTPGKGVQILGETPVVQTPEWLRAVTYMVDLCEVCHSASPGRDRAIQGLLLAIFAAIWRSNSLSRPDIF